MRKGARDDKNVSESEQQSEEQNSDYEKDRKIKRLTQINRELIETLKQQNEELTKKIQKQRLRSGRSSSLKATPKNSKQLESIRKQLSNSYKQIDMYKQIIQNLKAKEVSLDHVDRIKQLENRVKEQDAAIDNYQKEIKYLIGLKEKQDKELKVFQNEEVKQNKIAIEKQINTMKEKIKSLKKNAVKRQQIEKRQHAYFVELQKSLRKINDEYYSGKQEPKKEREEEQVLEKDWINVKAKLTELRRIYDENNKKLENISRQKLRQLKSFQENQLKLKEKMRKLNMLRSRIAQLTKLTTLKESKEPKQQTVFPKRQQVKNDKNRIVDQRQVKRWNVPESFNMQQGKVLPNSTFASDKQVLGQNHKYKIKQANVYVNGSGAPCLLNFIYQNQDGEQIDGRDMIENVPQNLDIKSFALKEKDYVSRISGSFKQGLLSSITFRSKLGSEATFEDENAKSNGEMFNFHRQANDIPSCFYGATIITNPNLNQIRICYLGFQFMHDW